MYSPSFKHNIGIPLFSVISGTLWSIKVVVVVVVDGALKTILKTEEYPILPLLSPELESQVIALVVRVVLIAQVPVQTVLAVVQVSHQVLVRLI